MTQEQETHARTEVMFTPNVTADMLEDQGCDSEMLLTKRKFVANLDDIAYYLDGVAISEVHYIRYQFNDMLYETSCYLPQRWLTPVVTPDIK